MAYSKTTWVNNETKLNADNMNKIENGIETNSNNMPTDINVDANNYLILEHNGVEITGQNKLVKIGKYNSNTDTFEIGNNLDVNGNIETNGLAIWESGQSEKAFLEYQYDSDNFRLINYNTNAITNIPLVDGSESTLISTDGIVDYLNMNLKTLFGNKSIVKDPQHPEDNDINLYRHQLKVTDVRSIIGTFIIISSNNLNIDSLQDLTTVTTAKSGYIIDGVIDAGGTLVNGRLTFNGTTWDLSGFTGAFDSITDVVTTI